MNKETLEEAAERFRSRNPGTMYGGNNVKITKAFKDGAKWQAERMYSEEEVNILLDALKYFISRVENGTIKSKTTYKMYKDIVEQYKKE